MANRINELRNKLEREREERKLERQQIMKEKEEQKVIIDNLKQFQDNIS